MLKDEKILGIPFLWFLLMFVIILAAAWLNLLPTNFLTGFALSASMGVFLTWIGNKIPKFSMLGGPSLLCLFLPALFTMWGIFPEHMHALVNNFYQGSKFGFIEFFIAALIAGSILTMDRNLLVKAGVRYAVPLLCGVAGTMAVAFLVGTLTGFGGKDAIRLIMIPIMGGGIGAGAVPIAQIFSSYGQTYEEIYSTILPAVAMGNIVAILMGALLNLLGRKPSMFGIKHFSGMGNLMQVGGEEFKADPSKKKTTAELELQGAGLLVAGTLYALGYIINKTLFHSIHAYAWTIILTAVLKITGLLPRKVEEAAGDWYGFMTTIGVPAIMICTGFCSMSLPDCIAAISNPAYLLIVVLVAAGSALFAGLGGLIMKMNFVESGITAGLCMANMGGAGDVAVLGASSRMELMPFAQISSRLGGALILLIVSLLSPWLCA